MNEALQRDHNGVAVQSLYPTEAVNVAMSASSQALTLPVSAKFIRVACTGNVYIEFGTGSVVATTSSVLFPAGVEMFSVPDAVTHVAVLQVGASSGVFSINRMK